MLTPAVIALVVCSGLVAAVALTAAVAGVAAAARWDPGDSGPRQLARERRAILVEVTLKVVLGCQLASLFLFVATADRLHPLLPGAMCAAGTLNASRFGYPTLLLKVVVFVACGLWLAVHRASVAAAGTALVRAKHLFVFAIAAALAAENVLQAKFFADLDPDILTSCCATVFGAAASGLGGNLAALPAGPSRGAFTALLALTLAAGLGVRASPLAAALYAALALALGAVAAAAVVTWVAPAFYELPAHHCPFCLLAPEHGRVGYALYLFLAVAVVAGAGSGAVAGLRSLDREGAVRAGEERRLCRASMIGFALFSLVASWPLVVSDFRPKGY